MWVRKEYELTFGGHFSSLELGKHTYLVARSGERFVPEARFVKTREGLTSKNDDLTKQLGDLEIALARADLKEQTSALAPYPSTSPKCDKCGRTMKPKLIQGREPRKCERLPVEYGRPEHLSWKCKCGHRIKSRTKDAQGGDND